MIRIFFLLLSELCRVECRLRSRRTGSFRVKGILHHRETHKLLGNKKIKRTIMLVLKNKFFPKELADSVESLLPEAMTSLQSLVSRL